MSAFRVIQISDTHLTAESPAFVANFDAMVSLVAARRPDLVVNTGDVTMDGAHRLADLPFARGWHDRFDVPCLFIPGNHDVGDNPWKPDVADPITDEQLGRYRWHFGDDWWLVDAGPWVLLGVNAQLFGSGLHAEETQWSFIEGVPERARGRPVALFIHKPLFKDDPGETDVSGRYVPPFARHRLARALDDAGVRLVASGHVHQHRQHRVRGVEHAWAPSTAFILPDRRQPLIGVKHVGFVAYTFDTGTVQVEIVEPPQLTNFDRDDFPELYAAHP
jgi:3',5'-cyclic AMP phosphodiesterase CpdA